MKSLRIRAILLTCWLVLFFSVERFLDPIDISNIAYILVWFLVVAILITPRIIKIPFGVILALPTLSFLLFKIWKGDFYINTANFMIEILAISMTILVTYRLSTSINGFENALAKMTIGHRERITEPESVGQGFIYREVRRARNHQRPLALLALSIDEKSLEITDERLVQEVQRAIMKQYKISAVSKTICEELEDSAIIVESNNKFLIALPETDSEVVPVIVDRLRRQVAKQAGVNLMIGMAALPKDSYTFEGLVEKAIDDMSTITAQQPLDDLLNMQLDESTIISK